MIKVYIPTDENFNYKECKKLYKKYQKLIGDDEEFRNIVKNAFVYSFFDDDIFLGCIYYYYVENSLYVNAFANRHHHQLNLECFKMSLDWFDCDIFAKTQHKTAIFCLLKSGFKKISNNLFKYERK